ncbi:MAG: hypothetical protein Q7K42_03080, partial [Candidatus Diapherotrites archaeon]|nr:hypothetical protein [Candidatus Diapherotrites archaeon]
MPLKLRFHELHNVPKNVSLARLKIQKLRILSLGNRFAEAEQLKHEVLALDPGNEVHEIDSLRILADGYMAVAGEKEKARAALERAIELSEKTGKRKLDVLFGYSTFLLRVGEFEKAKPILEELKKQAESNNNRSFLRKILTNLGAIERNKMHKEFLKYADDAISFEELEMHASEILP